MALVLIVTCTQVVSKESKSGPLIVFLKDIEKSMVGSAEYLTLKGKLDSLPSGLLVIGSHTQADNRKEKVTVDALSSNSILSFFLFLMVVLYFVNKFYMNVALYSRILVVFFLQNLEATKQHFLILRSRLVLFTVFNLYMFDMHSLYSFNNISHLFTCFFSAFRNC